MNRHSPVTVAVILAFLFELGIATAQAPVPRGIRRIALGQAVITKDPAQGDKCAIPKPLSSPVQFDAGVRELAYVVEIDPGAARQVKASIIGDFGTLETKGTNCNAYSICAGAICQTQFGSSVARLDGRPLKSGSFTLSVEVDGQNVKVPFTIR